MIEKLLPHLDAGKAGHHARTDAMKKKSIAREFFLLTSKPTLFACNVAEADLAAIWQTRRRIDTARATCAAVEEYARNHFATEAVVISAQIESELVDLSEAEARGISARPRRCRERRQRAHSRGLSSARAAHLPDDRRKRNARLDDSRRRQSAGGRRRDSLRFRARLHRRRNRAFRRSGLARLIRQGARSRQTADRRKRIRRARMATSSSSVSTCSSQYGTGRLITPLQLHPRNRESGRTARSSRFLCRLSLALRFAS